MRAQVEAAIEILRPAIQADQGDIILREVDEGTGLVSVELVGACGSCPSSIEPLRAGIERILKDRVPGIAAVRDVGDAADHRCELDCGATAAPVGEAEPSAPAETPVSL